MSVGELLALVIGPQLCLSENRFLFQVITVELWDPTDTVVE